MSPDILRAYLKLTLLAVTIAAESDPCANFTVTEHNGDRGPACTYDSTFCDDYLTPGWYRFQDDNTTFPTLTTECPEEDRCGAAYPLWLNGTHPTEADGVVDRTACLRYDTRCCDRQIDIKIKRCIGFHVYFLNKSSTCPARYCLDSNLPCPRPPTTAPPSMSTFAPGLTRNLSAVLPTKWTSVLFSFILSAYPLLESIFLFRISIEVQMKLKACLFGIPGARCPCGLAVRSGRTVYRIDSCAGTPAKVGFADCSDGRDLLKVLVKGTVYKIHLPTGSTVDLTLNPKSKFFNIQLHTSTDEWDMVSGLCGTFNGDKNDDVGADKFTKWRRFLYCRGPI